MMTDPYQLALQHHQAGRFGLAEQLYRQILAQQPNHADALHGLGLIAREAKQPQAAEQLIRRAIGINPRAANYFSGLAGALFDQGKIDEEIAVYRHVIAKWPNLAEAQFNLGVALQGKGEFEPAIAAYRRVLELVPDLYDAHNNLGAVLQTLQRFDESIASYRKAIALQPNNPQAHYNLGSCLQEAHHLDESIAELRKALQLRPNFPDALNNLANAYRITGQTEAAIDCFRRCLAIGPSAEYASNMLYSLHFLPSFNTQAIFTEHAKWNEQYARPLRGPISPKREGRAAGARLRIGYVSPDFRNHPVGRFILPLLRHHDRSAFELFCYSDTGRGDRFTDDARKLADVWRETKSLSDEQLAQRIREDRIDTLVDLTMHMAHNRMLVFARKPAPVQVTYLAYCSTTGLDAIDYRLTDPYLDPADRDQRWYSEKTVRLPRTYWCYEAMANMPPVNSPPAASSGSITFGCLNSYAKVNSATLAAWCDILSQVNNSTLRVHCLEGSHRQLAARFLEQRGLDPNRLQFVGWLSMDQYFKEYQSIDIALDPFPYGGGTTTCDALWMGVPTVSFASDPAISRGGLSILSNIGLPELVGHSVAQYVKIAADLARDLPHLRELREGMRERMSNSPLMNPLRFAQDVEAAYRSMM